MLHVHLIHHRTSPTIPAWGLPDRWPGGPGDRRPEDLRHRRRVRPRPGAGGAVRPRGLARRDRRRERGAGRRGPGRPRRARCRRALPPVRRDAGSRPRGGGRRARVGLGGVDVVVNNAGVAVGGRHRPGPSPTGSGRSPSTSSAWCAAAGSSRHGSGAGGRAPRERRVDGRTPPRADDVGLQRLEGRGRRPLRDAARRAPGDRIGVTVVCPAFFRTNLTESLRASNPHVEALTRRLVDGSRHGAAAVADRVYRGISRGDFLVLTHRDGKVAWMLKRLLPSRLYFHLLERQTRWMMGPAAPERAGASPGPASWSGR